MNEKVGYPAGETQRNDKKAGTLATAITPAGSRLLSLDVFRGATIAAMLLVNNPGNPSAVYAPLRHAEWHGWTFTDTIFPFFLWIVGVAITLSLAKRIERGDDAGRLFRHTLRRAAIIFALGLFLAGLPHFNLSIIRIPGVLQRIALCYLAATFIYLRTGVRGQIAWTGGLLAGYWILMKYVPVPGIGAGVLEKSGNFAQYIDAMVLKGHMWTASKTWDPEGIVSTIPAIATTLFGILAGRLLACNLNSEEKTAWMFFSGNVLAAAGLMLNPWMPVNKSLWTVPFSLFMAGLASSVYAACFWLVDVQGLRFWIQPFSVYGMNAIAIYVMAGLFAKSLNIVPVTLGDGSRITLKEFIFQTAFASLAQPINASLLFALCFVLLFYLIGYLLYRRRIFIKV